VDLGDLWRGSLSVRRLYVLTSQLPPGSAIWALENDIPTGYTLQDFLLMDVFQVLTGEPHPARPAPATSGAPSSPEEKARSLVERLRAQRDRLAKQGKEESE
jgi:hypothetical protein